MASPRSKEARLFYRCAYQRFDEARFLLGNQMNTAAVYLAGYGVECILKALILESVGERIRGEVIRSFRGRVAHDFDWLRAIYRERGGADAPREIVRQLAIVSDWSTDLRYQPGPMDAQDTREFLAAAAILAWADGRL